MPFTLEYQTIRGLIEISIRSMPNTMRRRHISGAKPMPDGSYFPIDMTTAAFLAVILIGRRCNGSWMTLVPVRSM